MKYVWIEVAKLYEVDVLKTSKKPNQSTPFAISSATAAGGTSDQTKTANMKRLLDTLDDKGLVFDIATRIGFKDICLNITARVPGLKYLKQQSK